MFLMGYKYFEIISWFSISENLNQNDLLVVASQQQWSSSTIQNVYKNHTDKLSHRIWVLKKTQRLSLLLWKWNHKLGLIKRYSRNGKKLWEVLYPTLGKRRNFSIRSYVLIALLSLLLDFFLIFEDSKKYKYFILFRFTTLLCF